MEGGIPGTKCGPVTSGNALIFDRSGKRQACTQFFNADTVGTLRFMFGIGEYCNKKGRKCWRMYTYILTWEKCGFFLTLSNSVIRVFFLSEVYYQHDELRFYLSHVDYKIKIFFYFCVSVRNCLQHFLCFLSLLSLSFPKLPIRCRLVHA